MQPTRECHSAADRGDCWPFEGVEYLAHAGLLFRSVGRENPGGADDGIGFGISPTRTERKPAGFVLAGYRLTLLACASHSIGDFFQMAACSFGVIFTSSADAELAVGMNCQIGKIVSFRSLRYMHHAVLKAAAASSLLIQILFAQVSVSQSQRGDVWSPRSDHCSLWVSMLLTSAERTIILAAARYSLTVCTVFGPSKIFLKSSQAASSCRAEWASAWRCISHIEILRDPALVDIR